MAIYSNIYFNERSKTMSIKGRKKPAQEPKTYIVVTHAQADKLESIDAFNDSLTEVFNARSTMYISSDTHHVLEIDGNDLSVASSDLNIQFNKLSFKKLRNASTAETYGFAKAPWARKKNVQVFVAQDLK